jgi:hypothetical protein
MHGSSRSRRRSPGPCFLGSRALHRTTSAALARWVRRTADRGTLSPRGGESASSLICRLADVAGKLLLAWARLGPLSVNASLRRSSHRRLPAIRIAAAHPRLGWRSGFPTGRPWDFALATARACATRHAWHASLTTRSPGPCFLGSRALHRTSSAALARWVRRTADRGTLSPRGGESASFFICRAAAGALRQPTMQRPICTTRFRGCVTCGDSNPTCLMRPFRAH